MIKTAVLEVNLTRHCTNRCVCCNHASAFAEKYYMPEKIMERDLKNLSKVLHTAFFCLQGGEPLLHPGILDMMDIAFRSGIADRYGILTNGKLLPNMPEEFWSKCKAMEIELRVSVYANLSVESLEYATRKAQSHGINFRPGSIGGFFKVLGNYPNGESFNRCPWVTCHTVHEGYFYICPISTFWPEKFLGLTKTIDGFWIGENTDEQALLGFIQRKEPLQSCRRCTGGSAPAVPWHECNTEQQWLQESSV